MKIDRRIDLSRKQNKSINLKMTESSNGGSENFYLSSHLLLLRPYKETWEAVSTVIGKKNAPPFIFSRVYDVRFDSF